MPKQLIVSGNDEKKPQEVQLSQINNDLISTSKFINSTQSSEIFSFPINVGTSLSTNSTNFVQINPLVIQFDNNSDYIYFNLCLCLTATNDGYIDIQIDGKSSIQAPFLWSGTNKQIIIISRMFTLTSGSHILKVFWKTSAGTVTIQGAGNNFVQMFNIY